MKNISIFLHITPRMQVKVKQHFGGIYCLHFQARRTQANEQYDADSSGCLLQAGGLLGLLFDPDDEGDIFLGNNRALHSHHGDKIKSNSDNEMITALQFL